MKAMVLEEYGKPLILREVEIPDFGKDEVLVKVRAAGVCGTDLKIWEGKVPTKTLPLIPGHEIAGEVVAIGENVVDFEVGDEVVISFYIPCGSCSFCRAGRYTICENFEGRMGFERDGGFAEYVAVPQKCLIHKPEKISFIQAAVVPDAIATCYHALVTRARVKDSDVVLMMGGGGGLGLHAIQIAKWLGARVIGVDVSEKKLELMKECGADLVLDANNEYLPDRVFEYTLGRGVNCVVEFVCSESSVEQSFRVLGRGSRLVLVAYSPQVKFDALRAHLFEIDILSTRAAGKQDIEECLKLVLEGKVRPVIGNVIELEELNFGFQMLREGNLKGRLVVKVQN
ncbi:alcohol dehydrogenase catalytic domain-containing protein [Atrimonas thermophila]|uniref:alcohol dehydrogenase catalytic domain-containing protein n=1 Tax=Atrimonas thermophila TaxID=3064161 RepID=UPI00399CD5B6